MNGHNSEINKMINIGVDGVRVITAAKNTVKIWNIVNKTLEKQLDGHKGGTYGMEIMTDGRLITSGGDGQLKVWDIIGEGGENINFNKNWVNNNKIITNNMSMNINNKNNINNQKKKNFKNINEKEFITMADIKENFVDITYNKLFVKVNIKMLEKLLMQKKMMFYIMI